MSKKINKKSKPAAKAKSKSKPRVKAKAKIKTKAASRPVKKASSASSRKSKHVVKTSGKTRSAKSIKAKTSVKPAARPKAASPSTSRAKPASGPSAKKPTTKAVTKAEVKRKTTVEQKPVEQKPESVATKSAANVYNPKPKPLPFPPKNEPARQIVRTPEDPNKTRYSDAELDEFRDIIIKKLDEARRELGTLQAQLTASNDNGTDDTAGTFKMLEDGSESLAKEEAGQLAGRQQKFIEQLENALVRIENKTYGICRVTGKLIPKERLRAVPHTTQSIEAKLNQYRD